MTSDVFRIFHRDCGETCRRAVGLCPRCKTLGGDSNIQRNLKRCAVKVFAAELLCAKLYWPERVESVRSEIKESLACQMFPSAFTQFVEREVDVADLQKLVRRLFLTAKAPSTSYCSRPTLCGSRATPGHEHQRSSHAQIGQLHAEQEPQVH